MAKRMIPSPILCSWRAVLLGAASAILIFLAGPNQAAAQQFNSDSYWVAPHGVVTFTLTAGQEYSMGILTAALLEDWEFNLGATRFREDPDDRTEGYYSATLYAKYMGFENAAGNGGWGVMGGTGVNPAHIEVGQVTDNFQSWWATGAFTLPFRDGDISLDLMPGVMVNLDQDRQGETAWGFTWSSRLAVYKIIPQSAIVGEVFGTIGEAYSTPQYKIGVRWENPRIVVAATYGGSFDGSTGARFEIGFSLFTDPILGFGLGGK